MFKEKPILISGLETVPKVLRKGAFTASSQQTHVGTRQHEGPAAGRDGSRMGPQRLQALENTDPTHRTTVRPAPDPRQ